MIIILKEYIYVYISVVSSGRYHILGPGETLRSLSLKYDVAIADLRKWNHIEDVTKLYLGQQLIVQKNALPEHPDPEHRRKEHPDTLPDMPRRDPVLGKLEIEDKAFLRQHGLMTKAGLDERIQEICRALEDENDEHEMEEEAAVKITDRTNDSIYLSIYIYRCLGSFLLHAILRSTLYDVGVGECLFDLAYDQYCCRLSFGSQHLNI
jgi:LysM repeat protein